MKTLIEIKHFIFVEGKVNKKMQEELKKKFKYGVIDLIQIF